ncbi:hypothetical protein IC582_024942 [Cucumis melo]
MRSASKPISAIALRIRVSVVKFGSNRTLASLNSRCTVARFTPWTMARVF